LKVLIQRVSKASVTIEGTIKGSIDKGLVVLVGFEHEDDITDIDWVCRKVANLRVFNDEDGIMNKSLQESDGELLLISQFTLHASTKKGNRPSYIKAARPETAIPLYEQSIEKFEMLLGMQIQTGTFGADMQVSLINDGPVTIMIDSKNRE